MKRFTLSAIAVTLAAPLAIALVALHCDSAHAACGECYNTGKKGTLWTDHKGVQQCSACE